MQNAKCRMNVPAAHIYTDTDTVNVFGNNHRRAMISFAQGGFHHVSDFIPKGFHCDGVASPYGCRLYLRWRYPLIYAPQAPKFCRKANLHSPKGCFTLQSNASFAVRHPSLRLRRLLHFSDFCYIINKNLLICKFRLSLTIMGCKEENCNCGCR